jgi:hypothetical protein
MYSIIRNRPLRRSLMSDAWMAIAVQPLSFAAALATTHLFYHWKSFLLEFVGFAATWFVIDFVLTTLRDLAKARQRTERP